MLLHYHIFWVVYHGYSVLLSWHHRLACYNTNTRNIPLGHGFRQFLRTWANARLHGIRFRAWAWAGRDAISSSWGRLVHLRRFGRTDFYGAYIHWGRELIARVRA